jgi:hypothetical protein
MVLEYVPWYAIHVYYCNMAMCTMVPFGTIPWYTCTIGTMVRTRVPWYGTNGTIYGTSGTRVGRCLATKSPSHQQVLNATRCFLFFVENTFCTCINFFLFVVCSFSVFLFFLVFLLFFCFCFSNRPLWSYERGCWVSFRWSQRPVVVVDYSSRRLLP